MNGLMQQPLLISSLLVHAERHHGDQAVVSRRVKGDTCIAARHVKWDERPLLIVVRKPDTELTRDELIGFFEGRIVKWWTPDDVVFVESIPFGATGKMLKNRLREQYTDKLLLNEDETSTRSARSIDAR